MPAPKRPDKKPLRVSVRDVYEIDGVGKVLIGQVLSGIMKQGEAVTYHNTILVYKFDLFRHER